MPTGITLRDDRDVDHILKTYGVTCKGIQGVRVNLTKAHVHSSKRLPSSYCTLRCRFSLGRVNRWSSAITGVPRDPRARIKESHPRDRIDLAIKGIQTMKQSQRDINSYLRVSDTSRVLRHVPGRVGGPLTRRSSWNACHLSTGGRHHINTMHHLRVRVR